MKRILTVLGLALALAFDSSAQDRTIPVWDNASAPHDNGLRGEMTEGEGSFFRNVTQTVLFAYLPDADKATTQGVLICPGGAYAGVSMRYEGHDVARWLAENGIAGFVLQYRLPNGHREIPLEDVREALRIVRREAGKLHVDPDRVGIMGFSAGGHLASTALTMLPREELPAFGVLVYPVISAGEGIEHKGSFDNLLGRQRTSADNAEWSAQNRVTADTPPCILLLNDDDRIVPPVNSTIFYEALKRHGIASTLLITPSGGHGGGFDPARSPYRNLWRTILLDWLQRLREPR